MSIWGKLAAATADDVFLHRNALPPGIVNLADGTRIEFDIGPSDRKPGATMAVNVRELT